MENYLCYCIFVVVNSSRPEINFLRMVSDRNATITHQEVFELILRRCTAECLSHRPGPLGVPRRTWLQSSTPSSLFTGFHITQIRSTSKTLTIRPWQNSSSDIPCVHTQREISKIGRFSLKSSSPFSGPGGLVAWEAGE